MADSNIKTSDTEGTDVPVTLERAIRFANALVPKNVGLMFSRSDFPLPPAMDSASAWLDETFPARHFPALHEAFAEYSRGNPQNRVGIFLTCRSSYVLLEGITIVRMHPSALIS